MNTSSPVVRPSSLVTSPYARFPKPYVIAHRGGGGNAPENTSCAFRALPDMPGVHAIETDIHRTKDGVIVATHDPTMDRISNITGDINALTWAEVKAADAGYYWSYDDGATFPGRGQGCRLLTLDELFALYGRDYVINIDLKPNDLTLIAPFLEVVNQHEMIDNIVVGSFHNNVVKQLRRQAPTLATAASLWEIVCYYFLSRIALEFLWKPHPQCVAFQVPETRGARRIVDRRFIRGAHKKGIEVHVWTVNYPQSMRRLLKWGVDGIITDYPDRMLALTRPEPYF